MGQESPRINLVGQESSSMNFVGQENPMINLVGQESPRTNYVRQESPRIRDGNMVWGNLCSPISQGFLNKQVCRQTQTCNCELRYVSDDSLFTSLYFWGAIHLLLVQFTFGKFLLWLLCELSITVTQGKVRGRL